MKKKNAITCCPVKPELEKRPLLSENYAKILEKTFKSLANTTRLRILHAVVKENELSVTEISKILGMKPTAISNQLQKLANQGIITSRRSGNHILYRILDPCVIKLLDNAWCFSEDIDSGIFKEI
ncbi:MAG: metalloregulator ArsR/SmtB family transcription factor [Actinobacteria bacterium]|nr:metalloregulator ArsR/SmtB family transcription factor [Actinomycetota bacterium]